MVLDILLNNLPIIILAGAPLLLYYYITYRANYWNRKNIANVPATPLLGNLKDVILFKKSAADKMIELYNHKNAINSDILGIHIFHKPTLIVRDPELIKQILVKDFNNFANRHSNSDEHSDSLGSSMLFLIRNPIWKQMRARLTPVFTSGRMKSMFHLINDIGNELNSYMKSIILDKKTDSTTIELKELCALFTTDVIASCAFGVQANSLKNPEAEFRKNGRKVFDFNWKRALEFSSIFYLPEIVPFFRFKVFFSFFLLNV